MKTEPEYPTAPEDEAEMNRREAEQREATLAHTESTLPEDDDEEDLEPEECAEDALERRIAHADYLRDKMRDDAMEAAGEAREEERKLENLIDRADMLRDERRNA